MTKKKGVLVALTNPVAGSEAEYNDWYNHTHLADVLKIPGIIRATRYAISPRQHIDQPKPWRYLAIYHLEGEDIDSVPEELKKRRGTAAMPISEALQEERLSWFFDEIFEIKVNEYS